MNYNAAGQATTLFTVESLPVRHSDEDQAYRCMRNNNGIPAEVAPTRPKLVLPSVVLSKLTAVCALKLDALLVRKLIDTKLSKLIGLSIHLLTRLLYR